MPILKPEPVVVLLILDLGDSVGALRDLEQVVGKDPDYDFHLAAGLLAHAYASDRNKEKKPRQSSGT